MRTFSRTLTAWGHVHWRLRNLPREIVGISAGIVGVDAASLVHPEIAGEALGSVQINGRMVK